MVYPVDVGNGGRGHHFGVKIMNFWADVLRLRDKVRNSKWWLRKGWCENQK